MSWSFSPTSEAAQLLGPASETGTIAATLDDITGSITGSFTAPANETGDVSAALDDITGSLVGTFTSDADAAPTEPPPTGGWLVSRDLETRQLREEDELLLELVTEFLKVA